jgi:hypothetical protein
MEPKPELLLQPWQIGPQYGVENQLPCMSASFVPSLRTHRIVRMALLQ